MVISVEVSDITPGLLEQRKYPMDFILTYKFLKFHNKVITFLVLFLYFSRTFLAFRAKNR